MEYPTSTSQTQVKSGEEDQRTEGTRPEEETRGREDLHSVRQGNIVIEDVKSHSS